MTARLFDLIAWTTCSVSSCNASDGTTLLTKPLTRASRALIGLPVSSIYADTFCGTQRATGMPGVEQKRPNEAPGSEKVALSDARAISQEATSWQPAAAASPSTCAMTGTGSFSIADITLVQSAKISSCRAVPDSILSSLRSCPELKTGPVLERTMQRSASFVWALSKHSSRRFNIASESTFRFFGLLRVMWWAPSSSRTETRSLLRRLAVVCNGFADLPKHARGLTRSARTPRMVQLQACITIVFRLCTNTQHSLFIS
uniref:Secreted protein n=1 Tax=Ixodes ricinus TaxID=34613 RepID=A0A6B0V6F9_IXORI